MAVNKAVPPVDTAYQSIVSPASGVADKIKLPPPHNDAPVTEGATEQRLLATSTKTAVDAFT